MKKVINGLEYTRVRAGVYVHYKDGEERVRYWNTGDIIKDRRQELKMSQDQLAEAVGVNRSTISRYENGKAKKIPHELIESLASTLNCSVDYLTGRVDDPHKSRDATDREQRLLEYYRRMNAMQQEALLAVAESMRKDN